MNALIIPRLAKSVAIFVVMASSALLVSHAWAQPSNRPLLTNQAGANPNLMIALDNSGSMAYPFDEAYGILYNNNNNNALTFCSGLNNFAYQTGVGYVLNGTAEPSRATPCYRFNGTNANGTPSGNVQANPIPVAYNPALTARNNRNAQRSADVNPVYYNPRTTYRPRIGADYLELVRPANINFVSNQASNNAGGTFYTVYRNAADGTLYATHIQKPFPAQPAWFNNGNNSLPVYSLAIWTSFPTHLEYNATNGQTPVFTYAYCRDAAGNSTVERDTHGQTIGCSSVKRPPYATSAADSIVTVFPPGHPSAAANTITLAPDQQRTDCAAKNGTCTNNEEVINILNWYHWYSTRQLATSTAVGQALSGSEFQNKLRIGYMPINDFSLPATFVPANNGNPAYWDGNTDISIVRNPAIAAPGTQTGNASVLRGVRNLNGGTAESTQLFGFLNTIQPRGGTPLQNAITKVANYYSVPSGSVENAWASNPAALATAANGTNPEMSCRRSFNLLFSDGGWTTSLAPAAGTDYDNTNGPTFYPSKADGTSDLTKGFGYLRTGDNSVAGRLAYTPYPSADTGGLADITAQYFWHTDLRPALPNRIQTRAGQPTFWQNMSTYTVGYFVRPTAEVTGGAGLTFDRIDQYQRQYTVSGYNSATKPVWPTGNLVTSSDNQDRVDDFIHAGFTGGGRAYSAKTSDDVRRIFSAIFADILSASGRDAGVSIGSSGGDGSQLAGSLKYTVSYRTLDNTGDITATELLADGSTATPPVVRWTANTLMQPAAARSVFTITGTNQPVDFVGNFSGQTDIQTALRTGADATRIADNTSLANFTNYLRGDNNALDINGNLFRLRPVNAAGAPNISAMVNPPSSLLNYARDYAYDKITSGGGVDGFDSYQLFAGRKLGYDQLKLSQLFVATNAGVVHSFNADEVLTLPKKTFNLAGLERAAFMPRRSLKRMLNYAKEPYNFEYVLDGPISQNDIFDRAFANLQSLPKTEEWRAWRQLGVGTGGRGEKLIYAINSPFSPAIASPGGEPSRAPLKQDFLWETGPDIVNAADSSDVTMGYIANSARSGQTETAGTAQDGTKGDWIVAINNGHYNGEANGTKAGLVVLNALNGSVIRTIPLPDGYSAGRGLSGVTLLRNYGVHNRVVAAYAGDGNGQLWRFNLTGDPSTWHVEHNRPLFTVPGHRPIFGAPAWQTHKDNNTSDGYIVVFATGMVLEENDLTDQGSQAIYGIWDQMNADGNMVNGATAAEILPAQLQEQNVIDPNFATLPTVPTPLKITDHQIDWSTQRGWFMPMVNIAEPNAASRTGERSIADVVNVENKVFVTSTVLQPPPTAEMCTASSLPGNYIYFLDARTASSAASNSFSDGTNATGRPNGFSVMFVPGGGFSRGFVPKIAPVKADGSSIPGVTSFPLIAGNNPYVDVDATSRPSNVGLDGEDKPSGTSGSPGPCTNLSVTIIGTEADPIGAGTVCPTTGWNRTQFQLSAPPKN